MRPDPSDETSEKMASGSAPVEQQIFNFTLTGTPGTAGATATGTPQTAGYNEANSSGVGTSGTTTGFFQLDDGFDGLSTTVPTGLTATRIVEATHGSTTFQGTGAAPGPTSAITQPFSDAGVPNAVRVIDSFTNNTNAAITGTVTYRNNLGSDSSTRYDTQGSGNRYLVSNQSLAGASPTDPTITGVFGNTGAAANPALTFANGNDNEVSSYNITVQPGQTVRLVTFGVVTGDVNRQGARTDANNDGVPDEVVGDIARGRSIAENITNGGNPIPTNSPFFAGISQEDRATIANFRFTAPTPTSPTPPANNAPCYSTGTRILTDQGEVAVEDLAIGDVVLTAAGDRRPIRWIGNRSYIGRFANTNPAVLPVCVKAGALDDGIPNRDLWVSPDHALYLDGVLIPVEHLVNGATIVKADRVESVTYWHIELDSHDVLLAEGAPAESFVDDGGRAIFHNAASYRVLYPHQPAWPVAAVYCAERVTGGYALEAVRRRLALRAGLPVAPARVFGELLGHLDLCDGSRITGWAQDLAHPDGPVCLDIVVDGAMVAMACAEIYRADLEAAGIGDGCHAFDLELPQVLTAETSHTVEVRRSADGAVVGTLRFEAAIAVAA